LRKLIRIILIVIVVAAVGGWFYWQSHKKAIIRQQIESAVSKGSGSLYFIHYDSSAIDEVNGNASFYNVVLQSDSLQKQLQQYDTAAAATIYNVRIAEVNVRGANIQGIINNTAIEANSIRLVRPVVYIISSGKKQKKTLNYSDSLAIYEKLLGKFKTINAREIIIENGNLYLSDKTGTPHTSLKDISIQLKNFRIDSTKNYENIISYFLKDIVAGVQEVYIMGENRQTVFSGVEYNAPGKFIKIRKFQQKNNQQQVVFDINNTTINDISTNSFILNHELKAEELITDGGLLTFYRSPNKNVNTENDEIEIDSSYFNEALLNTVSIGNTKIIIYNKAKPAEAPLTLTNVRFSATDIQKLNEGTSVRNLISKSTWILSADGFSYMSENKRYKMNVGAFEINNVNSSMRVKSFSVTPVVSEEAFAKSLRFQDDLYNLDFRNIEMTGINIRMLITQKRLEAETAVVQPTLRIFMDRTVTPNPVSKVGNYPHQKLQTIKMPFRIKKLTIKNGMVAYKEKSELSGKAGVIFFNNINGSVSNVTNIKEHISQNNLLVLDATGNFLGVSKFNTIWKLPLNTTNGAFEISGTAGAFNAEALNPVTEHLGMASIKKGQVNKLIFDLKGNDHGAKGSATLLYEDLKLELLKSDSGDIKKKGLMSFVANALMKDRNPQNGIVRTEPIDFTRDIHKSFFSLIWKSIFSAAKKTTQKL
jgi:hypothetical protein